MPDLLTIAFFGAVSLLSAGCAVLVTGRLMQRRGARGAGRADGPVFADTPRRYEFREGYLISPVDANDAFLPSGTDRAAAFEALSDVLAPYDAELPTAFSGLARRGESFVMNVRFGQDRLAIAGRPEQDRLIVTIGPARDCGGRQVIETAALDALRHEAEDLRDAVDSAHVAIWRQDPDGRILWANSAYLSLLGRGAEETGTPPRWPVPALFEAAMSPLPETGTVRRHRLPRADAAEAAPEGDAALWFEIAAERRADGSLLGSALPVDRLVAAETSLRDFVQTLSQTFAHLPVGLAVFDRRRDLMLFNPALVTLSTLEPAFLSRRPSLVAFLDALRDRQRMPEPKNYRGWRDEIARLEADARAGTYQELWSLPDGQSFRVIGRPHPDGAIAFMFEDITSEVSLTRKFRGDLDLFTNLLDALPGAQAVFGGDGLLVLANAAFRARWADAPSGEIGTLSLVEATRRWQDGCAPGPAWGDLRDFAGRAGERAAWCEEVETREGVRLLLRVAPLTGGAVSVAFYPKESTWLPPPAPVPRPRAAAAPATPFRGRRASAP